MSEDITSKATEVMVNLNMMETQANADLGITQEYNKQNRDKLWDSKEKKVAYKEKVFDENQTYKDPISGKVLHKSQKAAQNKYHMKNSEGENTSTKWAEHSAETDHINALKDVHNVAKHNPFLSDSDFKEIMNSDENYRILSKRDNTSKGEKNDWQIITDKDSGMSSWARVQMAKEKIGSDIALKGKFAVRTVKNIGNEFATGAKDTLVKSAIPLTAEAVRKLCKVANGEESLGDVTKEMGKVVVDVAVAGGTNNLVLDVVNSQLRNSKNAVFSKLANSNEVAQIITVAMIVKESAVKYINGEIDGKEFIDEVGVKGATMVAGMIGGAIGGEIGAILGGIAGTVALPGVGTAGGVVAGKVIGEILGTIITTVACSAIVSVYNTSKHLNDYKLKETQIRKLEAEALKEMENQRDKFRSIVEREHKYWDDEIQNGFNMILSSTCEQTFNLQGVTDGLDKILALFGNSIAFKNLDEYEAQLDRPFKLSF
ncbi:hypothetical protein FC820_06625 [Clostridium sporogenes]|uniref:hypothetical protein n=1 Tax=Clostridium sporogenes TaxID=1509 RepID=UPI0013D75170|nr:hypothetical protein [Clostridium sporogenes]EJE7236436.1 hypothetical protein [Clostridium botulinum]NFE81113.1 hypothetical protein [Clostridium sporogenes]NFG68011.1 hypothetical protein [Clostridium sporogenes]